MMVLLATCLGFYVGHKLARNKMHVEGHVAESDRWCPECVLPTSRHEKVLLTPWGVSILSAVTKCDGCGEAVRA